MNFKKKFSCAVNILSYFFWTNVNSYDLKTFQISFSNDPPLFVVNYSLQYVLCVGLKMFLTPNYSFFVPTGKSEQIVRTHSAGKSFQHCGVACVSLYRTVCHQA